MSLTSDSAGTIFPMRRFSYGADDTILYALGVGAGAQDPVQDLPFVYEPVLRALPTQATVVAWDDSWIPALGLNEKLIVHGEQRIDLHQPLPTSGTLDAQTRIVEIVDKGADRGALLYVETRLHDVSQEGALIATLLSTVFARGDGGFGGPSSGGPKLHSIPDRQPDGVLAGSVPVNQALIYRLSGDKNPLHVDPAFAAEAGFPRPILHGLSTFGMAARILISEVLGHDPAAVEHFSARFSAPLFAGEAVRVLTWKDGPHISFRLLATDGDRLILDHGQMRLRD